MEFSHLDSNGNAQMVDVSAKDIVARKAVAQGKIILAAETIKLLNDNLLKKGDALTVAKIAGISAAKNTFQLIPLCHNIQLNSVDISFTVEPDGVTITACAKSTGKTGVEMEALTAVSLAALTIYDMCKAVDKKMVITNITLLEKTKGPL